MIKRTVESLIEKKRERNKLTMLTAYDFNSAMVCDRNGVDAILVSDTLGRAIQGMEDSHGVTITEMLYHSRIVSKGIHRALLVVDMPYQTYDEPEKALKNARLLMQEGKADCIMMQGKDVAESAKYCVENGIPVIARIGLELKKIDELGPYSAKSSNPKEEYQELIQACLDVQEAGCSALVLRTFPAALAKQITQLLTIPVIGFGSGRHTDGQFMQFHDIMGITDDFRAKHVKRYAHLSQVMLQGVKAYMQDVERGNFPSEDYEY
jgi:3-methyl-2-oxobutanoate hydroxymethyltransferase